MVKIKFAADLMLIGESLWQQDEFIIPNNEMSKDEHLVLV